MSASHDDSIANAGRATMTPAASNRNGEWIVPDVSYVEPSRRFCAYCGRPIARRYWGETTPDGDLAFCGPDHAAMRANGPTPAAGRVADFAKLDD